MNTENIIINCLGASNTQILIDNEGIKTKEINPPVLLGLRLRCTTRNYGKSGTNIAKQEGREDSYFERTPKMEHGADVIIVHGDGTQQALGLGGYLDVGLNDTMKDLIVNLVGAVIFSIIGYFHVKKKGTGKIATRFIPQVDANTEHSNTGN